jgi:hypothetical protein
VTITNANGNELITRLAWTRAEDSKPKGRVPTRPTRPGSAVA